MEPTRQLYWNTTGKELMYVLTLVVMVVFLAGTYKRFAGWRQGRRGQKVGNLPGRFKTLMAVLLTHNKQVFMGKFRRNMHLGIFFGFVVLLFGSLIIALQEDLHIPLFFGRFYLGLSLLMDIAGLAALIGIIMATYKRFKKKPDREITVDDCLLLGLVLLILVTGFVLEGLRIYVTKDLWGAWSPVGLLLSLLFKQFGLGIALARSTHAALWYFHMVLALGFIAYIPYSKLFHLVAAPFNILLKPLEHPGTLNLVDKSYATDKGIGVTTLTEFSRKQLLELDACLACGRCQKHCPVYSSGEPFSPKKLIHNLKKNLRQKQSPFGKINEEKLLDNVLREERIWSCTTCGLCEKKCPVQIEHIKRIVDLRRGQGTSYPPKVQQVFTNLEQTSNPLGQNPEKNLALGSAIPTMSELKSTEVLYWIGCLGAYETRNQRVTQAMLHILHKANVDFAVLGQAEKCCGDSARRLGNETLFVKLAQENIKTLHRYKFKTIVTHCPHCYNVLKNEYPQLGGNFQVMHHSEFILDLIQAGKIKPKNNPAKVTYHDPCYLGRFNNIYTAPRQVLRSVPGVDLLEMKQNKSMSFCCGAGGGNIWTGDIAQQKIGELRLKEAAKLEPEILASACSLCLSSLSAAQGNLNLNIKTKDIAEIVSESL